MKKLDEIVTAICISFASFGFGYLIFDVLYSQLYPPPDPKHSFQKDIESYSQDKTSRSLLEGFIVGTIIGSSYLLINKSKNLIGHEKSKSNYIQESLLDKSRNISTYQENIPLESNLSETNTSEREYQGGQDYFPESGFGDLGSRMH